MAAENKYHGHIPVAILADNVALPSATSEYTTDDYNFIGPTNVGLKIVVYANTAVEIATGQAFNIEIMAGSSADPTSGPVAENHVYIVHKTSADGELAWADNALIATYPLDAEFLGTNVYVRLKLTTDANESADYYSAYVVPVA